MIDVSEARRRYRAELEQALARAGGKTRKRTLRAMVRATTEYRGTVLDAPDADVLVWSDLRLGHTNIIDYQSRPFFDTDDMNAELWRAFERVLSPASVLVLVGDVAMGDALGHGTWERIRRSPARHKHLVIGNHDLTGLGELRAEGFDDVWSVMVRARPHTRCRRGTRRRSIPALAGMKHWCLASYAGRLCPPRSARMKSATPRLTGVIQ